MSEENSRKEVNDYYAFVNELGDTGRFKSSLFHPLMVGTDAFSKKLAELRIDHNDQKAALLISRLVCSKDFSTHDPNVYSDSGVKLGEDDHEDFEEIFAAARERATPVTQGYAGAVNIIAEKTKRKKKMKAPKLNQQQRIEKFFARENFDDKGVEKEYIQSIKGRLDLPIGNLTVSQKIQLPISETKVRNMADDMVDTFDITQMYFVVMPDDTETFDENNLENNRYQVLHGRHRLRALQLLIEENKISLLPSMESNSVPCLILGSLSVGAANWANLRNGDIAARFEFQTQPS